MDEAAGTESVILLHGLARTRRSMRPIERALRREGYHVVNVGYPSRRFPVEHLAEVAFAAVDQRMTGRSSSRIHFVTHSMGGILLRAYLGDHVFPNLGRVVMLAPPNQGSELVDRLRRLRLFRWLNGPAGPQLGTGRDGLPRRLSAVNFELGVIAGTRAINPVLSRLIPRPNDGKVSVESARVAGMTDFLALPVTHTFMMNDARVIAQTSHFIRHGRFQH